MKIHSWVKQDVKKVPKYLRRGMALSGTLDTMERTLSLRLASGEKIIVPLSIFSRSPSGLCSIGVNSPKPNFRRFKIIDWGWAVAFGDFESGIDSIVIEYDFLKSLI